jgi:hypothetical protein
MSSRSMQSTEVQSWAAFPLQIMSHRTRTSSGVISMMASWWTPILVVWFTSLDRTLITTFPYCTELTGLNDIRQCDQPTLIVPKC